MRSESYIYIYIYSVFINSDFNSSQWNTCEYLHSFAGNFVLIRLPERGNVACYITPNAFMLFMKLGL